MPKEISYEILREKLAYDPETGLFIWVKPRRADFINRVAGFTDKRGYRRVKILGKLYLEHRLAWLWMTGEWPAIDIDHINMIKDDNRWKNLRLATVSQNSANIGLTRRNTSGLKNVTWNKNEGRWIARVQKGGKRVTVGYFDCPAAAFFETIVTADILHGPFYRHI